MPQLLVLALLGAGFYAGYRWVVRELRRSATSSALEKDMGRLEYDPASGVYKPANRG